MQSYLNIVKNVLDNGTLKKNRTGISAYTLPNVVFSHNMKDGFPLLTTRQMPFKSMCVELEGFINSVTSKQWYKDRKCNFWNEWASPVATHRAVLNRGDEKDFESDKTYNNAVKEEAKLNDDLGPVYGYQWRRFGEAYDEDDDAPLEGTDQLNNIVGMLHNDPNSRRGVCSSWNPNQVELMALPSCHTMFGVVHIDGVLNLYFIMRSGDAILGICNNIASYALLLKLLAYDANMKVGNLTGFFADFHIYENHIDGAREMLNRKPLPLPTIELTHSPKSIFKWTHKDIILHNYQHHSKIKFEIAV